MSSIGARPCRWLGPPGPVDLLLTARGRTLSICGVLPEADRLVTVIVSRCGLTPVAPERFARSYLRRPRGVATPQRVPQPAGAVETEREAAVAYYSAGKALSAAIESFHRSHGRYPATQSEYENLRGKDGASVLAELLRSAQASGIGACRLGVCDPNPRSSAYPLATVVGDRGTLEVLKGGRVRVTAPDGRTELM